MLVEMISDDLQLPAQYLRTLASSADHRYKSYEVPKHNGDTRLISQPSRELKTVQRWLVARVVESFPVHPAALAYRRHTGIAVCAAAHTRSRYLLRMDFKDFFPSLTSSAIRAYAGQNPEWFKGWDESDLDFFCRIVCRGQRLTIGAPSSPSISNALCRPLDGQLADLAEPRLVKYTRYADDLFFSAHQAGVLSQVEAEVPKLLRRIPYPGRLRINGKKTAHLSMRGRRVVTGLVLTSVGQVSIGRQRKRAIRSWIHRFEKLHLEERRRLAGMLGFAKGVEPAFLNRIMVKYGAERIAEAMRAEHHSENRQ